MLKKEKMKIKFEYLFSKLMFVFGGLQKHADFKQIIY